MSSFFHLELVDQLLQSIVRTLQLALPDNMAAPTCCLQSIKISLISRNVFTKLFGPEFGPGLWGGGITTVGMSMPKATMNENAGFPFWQNNIRAPGQIFHVKPEPEAASMQEFPDNDLWFGVAATYGAHHAGSCGFINNVHPIPLSGCLIK